MLKYIKVAASRGRSTVLTNFVPVFSFSNSQQEILQEKVGSNFAQQNNTSQNKQNATQELYFPLKRINFSKRNMFPIYMIDEKKSANVPKFYSFLSSYFGLFAYGISYVFFFDIYNYWHILPLSYLFYRGSKSFFTDTEISGTMVQSVFLNKDGKTLIVTVPKSPVYYKYQEDIDLSEFGKFDNKIKLTVDLEKALKVGFLNDLKQEQGEDGDFIQIKTNKQKQQEKEQEEQEKEDMSEAEANLREEAKEAELQNIVILIERDGKTLPLYIDLTKNKNKAYDDYLTAIAGKKKIVMRETKDEA